MQLLIKLKVLLLVSLFPVALLAATDPITINFRDADIDSVVGAYGHLLKRTFIIDPRVRGKISIESTRPLTPDQAYQLLQATLRLQGFTIVESGSVYKVIPEIDAKIQSVPVAPSGSSYRSDDNIITQIIRLNYESAQGLIPILRPLISQNNTISANTNNNTLIITDYAANIRRIERIISNLDVPIVGEIEVISISNGLASDIAVQISRLLDDQNRSSGPERGQLTVDASSRVSVSADNRINSVILRSTSRSKMNLAKDLITKLDQPSNEPGNTRVIYLRNAEATKLVQSLKGILGTDNSQNQNQAQGKDSQQSTTITTGSAIIAADSATNSLIITAPDPVYRNLQSVIEKLDSRRVQVYIESLIVEVSADKSIELGIQWQFLSQPSAGTNAVIGGTNLPARGSGSNIIDATTNILSLGRGLNIGVVRSDPIIGGGTNGAVNLGVLARALETETGAKILATPNLITLDNEEAKIIIGQNVPFITGSYTASGAGAGAVNPFQTIERRDVGTTLRVKPQVAEGGTVRMQIFQEVSSVQDANLSAGLITNKRAIESNVLVDDGQVVVLGGLIEERIEGGVSMVPGLGRVPLFGNLFRYDNRKKVKTNLLVFLRPVILRDSDSARRITADRYDYIKQLHRDSRITPHDLIPESQFQTNVQ